MNRSATSPAATLDLLALAFTVFNGLRTLAYLPTIWSIVDSGRSDQHALFTWFTWFGANATMAAWVDKARQLIDDGVKPPHVEGRGKHPKPALEMVPAFRKALDASGAAKAGYAALPPSAQRDYLEWIADAKRAETRDRRIAQAIGWLAEGKRRNWKYETC